MKDLYGEVKLGKSELLDSNAEYMELEYYKIKNTPSLVKEDECTYGIEVVKNEYQDGKKLIESNEISNITKDEELLNRAIEKMKEYRVTPFSLEDNLIEYLKSQEV